MRDFILGFVAFPLMSAAIPPILEVTEPALEHFGEHPLWMLPLPIGVMLLLIDWDWKRKLFNRYAEWRWERKHCLLRQLKADLGEQP